MLLFKGVMTFQHKNCRKIHTCKLKICQFYPSMQRFSTGWIYNIKSLWQTDYEDKFRRFGNKTLCHVFLDDEMVDDGVSLFASHSSSLQSRFSFPKCPPIVLKVIGVDKRQELWYQGIALIQYFVFECMCYLQSIN